MGFEEGLLGATTYAQTTFFFWKCLPPRPYNQSCFCPPNVALLHLLGL